MTNPGHALRYTKGNEKRNIPQRPVLPTKEDVAILRRAAAGYVFVTYTEKGPAYTYDDGSRLTLRRSKIAPGKWDDGERNFARMVKEGWLVPDKNDSLFPDGPPQIYRALKP